MNTYRENILEDEPVKHTFNVLQDNKIHYLYLLANKLQICLEIYSHRK